MFSGSVGVTFALYKYTNLLRSEVENAKDEYQAAKIRENLVKLTALYDKDLNKNLEYANN